MIYEKRVKGVVDQGDIIFPVRVKDWLPWWKDNDDYPIVILTPTCDIAKNKATHHRFSVLEPLPLVLLRIYQEVVGPPDPKEHFISKKKNDKFQGKITSIIQNSFPRYHYLQSDGDLIKTDRIVDFEVVISVPIDTFSDRKRVARLISPYREQLIHRYTHHGMRIGTPDTPRSKIISIINDFYSELKISVSE